MKKLVKKYILKEENNIRTKRGGRKFNFVVYDKVSWHYPGNKNCPNLETAISHFRSVMSWLRKNSLLSTEGREILRRSGIDSDFYIISAMLNNRGYEILQAYYSKWLKTIDYSSKKLNFKRLCVYTS